MQLIINSIRNSSYSILASSNIAEIILWQVIVTINGLLFS